MPWAPRLPSIFHSSRSNLLSAELFSQSAPPRSEQVAALSRKTYLWFSSSLPFFGHSDSRGILAPFWWQWCFPTSDVCENFGNLHGSSHHAKYSPTNITFFAKKNSFWLKLWKPHSKGAKKRSHRFARCVAQCFWGKLKKISFFRRNLSQLQTSVNTSTTFGVNILFCLTRHFCFKYPLRISSTLRHWTILSSHEDLTPQMYVARFKGFSHWWRAVVFGLTSKILPLGSTLNFDADVKKTTARHPMWKPLHVLPNQATFTLVTLKYWRRRQNVDAGCDTFRLTSNYDF